MGSLASVRLLLFVIYLCVSISPAAAEDPCGGVKVRVAGKAMLKAGKCTVGPILRSVPIDSACADAQSAKITAVFAKTGARRPCRRTGDAPEVDAEVHAFVADLLAAFTPAPEPRCAAAKMRAASVSAVRLAKCHAKALAKGRPVDPECTAKVHGKLVTAFTKAEAAGGCLASGDAGAIARRLGAAVQTVIAAVAPPQQGCVGSCAGGAYCESASCPQPPICYSADALASMLMCGGVLDECCGFGSCQDGSYCKAGGPACDVTCLDASEPLSQTICAGAFTPGCGIGTCTPDGSYCDDCRCYLPETPTSQMFCGCGQTCGEVTPGCGVGTCVSGSYCDECVCYPSESATSRQCCPPAGIGGFQRVYHLAQGDGGDHAIGGIKASDGGYISVGLNNGRILRTDRELHIVWARQPIDTAMLNGVAETTDGFVVAGSDDVEGVLTELDFGGTGVWSKTLPGPALTVEATSDGGLIVGGWLSVAASTDKDAYLVKTDALGDFQWGWRYGGSAPELAQSIVETAGGYLVLGSTRSIGAGGQDLLLIQTDAQGNLQWAKTIGGAADEADWVANQLKATADGGYVAVTSTSSFGSTSVDALVVKLDANGDVAWAQRYDGGDDDYGTAIAPTPQGYMLIGVGRSAGNRRMLTALNASGDVKWARGFGPDLVIGYAIGGVADDGGGFILTEIHSYEQPNLKHRLHFIKTDPDGFTRGCHNGATVAMTATPTPVVAQLQTLATAVVPNTLQDRSATMATYPLLELTLCEASAAYLCHGIATGNQLCSQ